MVGGISNRELAEFFLGIGQALAANNGVDAARGPFPLRADAESGLDIAELELAEFTDRALREAIAVIDKVQEASPYWVNAQMRRRSILNPTKKEAEAASLLALPREESRQRAP